MPTYTVISRSGGAQLDVALESADEAAVVAGARRAFGRQTSSVAVARGRGADLVFLGVWERDHEGRAVWLANNAGADGAM